MTQYLLSVWHTETYPSPPEEDMQAMFAAVEAFNTTLQESGAWVFAGGLHEPSTATVVDGTGGEVVTTAGPFSESKDLLGGLWVIEVPDLNAALALAAEGSKACGSAVEVRPFQGE